MKKTTEKLQKVENFLIIVTFSVMVIASFSQVINRNILKMGIGWFEELAVYCMIWMTLLGTEMGLRDGTQASVTALIEKLKPKAKEIIQIVSKLLVVVFTAMITNSAWGMVFKQIKTGQTSPALKIPMAIPYSALLVSFAIMTIVQGVTLFIMIKEFARPTQEELDSDAAKGGEDT